MRYKNEDDSRHELKILLAAAVVSVLAAVAVAGLVPAESAAGEADGQQADISGDYSYTVKADGTAEITGYSGSGRDITVPGELEGHAVTGIGRQAFRAKNNIVSATLAEGMTDVGAGAFRQCKKLVCIKLPDSLEKIGAGAFTGCVKLENIEVPDGITVIEDNTFTSCERMTEIKLPERLVYIGNSAFDHCYSLESIDIPDSVTEIGRSAFSWCSSLKKLEIPYGVTVVQEGLLHESSGITDVMLPDTVETIGEGAFAWCENLKEIDIPDGTTSIGKSAFAQCESLGRISVPDSVTSIGKNAFKTQICGLVIYCSCGSYAEKYALENDLEFAGSDYSSKLTPARTYKNGKIVKKCCRCGKTLINRTIPRASTLGLWATEYQYTGSRIQPHLKIKDENGKKLMQNTDYKVSYVTDGRSIGKQTVKITYRGKYTGTRKLSYRIFSVLKKPSFKAKSAKKGRVKLSWSKVSNAKGYKIYVKEPGSSRYRCRLTKDVMVRSVTHKGLKRGKTYRYKMRSYKITNGTTEYGPYSEVRSVKVK